MHDLQALITAKKNQPLIQKQWPSALFLECPQQFVLIPFTKELQAEIAKAKADINEEDEFAEAWEELKKQHAAIFRKFSESGVTMMVLETMDFGADGFQDAVVWDKGEVFGAEEDADEPINEALKYLGVKKDKGMDEFETMRLGGLRSTEKAIQLARAKSEAR